MAPLKILPKTSNLPIGGRKASKTTTTTNVHNDQNADPTKKMVKRKADGSPGGQITNRTKRSALGSLTNAVMNRENHSHAHQHHAATMKKGGLAGVIKQKSMAMVNVAATGPTTRKQPLGNVTNAVTTTTTGTVAAAAHKTHIKLDSYGLAGPRPAKVMTRAAVRATLQDHHQIIKEKKKESTVVVENETVVKAKEAIKAPQKPVTRRISNEFEKTEDSLSSPNSKMTTRRSINAAQTNSTKDSKQQSTATTTKSLSPLIPSYIGLDLPQTMPPADVHDFDKETFDDPYQVSEYAMDIFNYLKSREIYFPIEQYMERQIHISAWMRTLLVDWMVEVQETFELNHETLYLAIKLVDIYLSKVIVVKENLQLLGATALLISCKFDERTPPLIEDFLYICDNAYSKTQLIKMEIDLFSTVGYDLSIPLSYRFLRRYARCSKTIMPILTLARYILELSLMDYASISLSDSKMACAALFMALRMNKKCGWDKTLEYYTGYKLTDFADIIPIFNAGLHQKPRETVKVIRSKYSHKIFHEVAKIPLMSNADLLSQSTDVAVAADTNNTKTKNT